MKLNYFYNSFIILILTLAVGILAVPAVFVFAQTNNILANETAALQDLSQIAGQEITSVAQAKEICNLERFLADCAEIGKKHNLYKPEEIKTVNAVLAELKGKVVEDLKNCADETCLVDVANRLAKTISAKNPTIAKQIDLTAAKVEEKKVIVDAAKEAGVSFRECQAMNPDTASIDLLRACAKLAKDSRVMKYIPEERKQLVQINNSSLQLREALGRGEYQCGNNTLDGCGNFCLNPPPEARAGGLSAIPQVCRDIASRFFGGEGIKQLETAYGQVKQVSDFYYKQAQSVTFITLDGRVLLNPKDVGRYLEEEGKKGNVEAVEKGMEFMVTQGFVKPADKEFAIKMIKKVKESGGFPDFDACRKDPNSCKQFIPEEDRAEFELMDWIYGIMKAEMTKEGVPGPEICEDVRYGEKCLIASKRALPQIEAIAASNPEAVRVVNDIKERIKFGEQGMAGREKARQEFEKSGGLFFGEKQFNNFDEVDDFCRINGQQCLNEAAKQGFINKDFAEKKFEMVIEQQYRPEYNVPFGGFSTTTFPGQGPYQGFIPPGQGGYPPGQIPGFTAPGQGFGLPAGFNKEETLRLFKEWLENPQGQPPMPFIQYQVPQQVPQSQYPPQYPQYPQPYPQQPSQPTNIQPYPYQSFCAPPPPQPCPIGQYREIRNDPNTGCPIYGQCVVYQKPPQYEMPTSTTLPPKPIPICPLLPTVVSCPAGQEKIVTWSSPECGAYYSCKQVEVLPPPPTSSGQIQHIWKFGAGNWTETSSIFNRTDSEYTNYIASLDKEAATGYFVGWKQGAGNSDPANWRNFGIPIITQTPPIVPVPDPLTDCSKYGSGWHTMDSSGKCFDSSMQNYRMPDGALYSCESNRVSGCSDSSYNYVPPSGQKEQIWNSLGLRSWIRSDADQSRIESLKQSCANVPSNANIWMPNAGLSSSQDFGMPDPNKCAQAANCPSDKYFDGSSCVSSSGAYNTGGSSCSAALVELLGSGCHQMYTDNSGNQVYCDGPMTKSAKAGDTAVTSGCSSSYSSQTCPSGQYWNGTVCVNSTTSGSCPSGQYWNGTACVNTTTSDVPIANCPSFAHEMSGYCMLNNDASRCAEYSSASSEANYTSSVCQAHTSSYTSPSSGSTSCPSGQYWYVPTDGGAGYCKTSETSSGSGSGSTTSCPSPSYWDPAINACNPGSGSTTSCPSGQYWNGTSCVLSCPEGQTWDGATCVSPSSSSITTQHLLAQIFTILQNFSKILELSR